MKRFRPAALAGLFAGLLFFLHALVPESHAWPMIWPAIGGAMAISLAARRQELGGFWSSVGFSARAGGIAGLIFLVATAAALYALSFPALASAAQALGADGPVVVTGAVLLSLTGVAVLGLVLAAAAGAVAFPLVRLTQR